MYFDNEWGDGSHWEVDGDGRRREGDWLPVLANCEGVGGWGGHNLSHELQLLAMHLVRSVRSTLCTVGWFTK